MLNSFKSLNSRRGRLAAAAIAAWLVIVFLSALSSAENCNYREVCTFRITKFVTLFFLWGLIPISLVASYFWIRRAPKTPLENWPTEDDQQKTIHSIGPKCGSCGSITVLRTSNNKLLKNHYFWGCSLYPTCKHITPVLITPMASLPR
jgi:hypothetical protein